MISRKYNLKCARGHYHYSPTPEAFAGSSCGKPFANGDIRKNTPRCVEKLKKL